MPKKVHCVKTFQDQLLKESIYDCFKLNVHIITFGVLGPAWVHFGHPSRIGTYIGTNLAIIWGWRNGKCAKKKRISQKVVTVRFGGGVCFLCCPERWHIILSRKKDNNGHQNVISFKCETFDTARFVWICFWMQIFSPEFPFLGNFVLQFSGIHKRLTT